MYSFFHRIFKESINSAKCFIKFSHLRAKDAVFDSMCDFPDKYTKLQDKLFLNLQTWRMIK